jgi:hypothetical protein
MDGLRDSNAAFVLFAQALEALHHGHVKLARLWVEAPLGRRRDEHLAFHRPIAVQEWMQQNVNHGRATQRVWIKASTKQVHGSSSSATRDIAASGKRKLRRERFLSSVPSPGDELLLFHNAA